DFVLVFQKFASLIDLYVDVVFAGLGADADFLELLLMRLGLGAFARLLVAKLAVVHDLAHRRPLGRRDFDKIKLCFASHFHGLRSRHNAQLLTLRTDESNGTDPNLFVDTLATIVRWMAVGWGNASISFNNEPGMLPPNVDPAGLGRCDQ